MSGSGLAYRRLVSEDAAALRALRLSALVENPSAFSADVDEESARGIARFRDWIDHPDNVYFAAFDGAQMVGMLCLTRESRAKLAHKAMVRSVHVAPEFRGLGVAKHLLRMAIDHARSLPGLRRIVLTVTEGNSAAIRVYEALGFVRHGCEPEALVVDGVGYDEAAYSLDLMRVSRESTR